MMEVMKNMVAQHKSAGIEMDVEVKLMISNAVQKLETYKGVKLDLKI